jgi:hypothetical protein
MIFWIRPGIKRGSLGRAWSLISNQRTHSTLPTLCVKLTAKKRLVFQNLLLAAPTIGQESSIVIHSPQPHSAAGLQCSTTLYPFPSFLALTKPFHFTSSPAVTLSWMQSLPIEYATQLQPPRYLPHGQFTKAPVHSSCRICL